MQKRETYEKEDIEIIIRGYLDGWVEWRDDGLYVKKGMFENDPSAFVFHWTPPCQMEWDGAPDYNTAQILPRPCTVGDFAAFMLNGIGAIVGEAYGTSQNGPDEAAMDELIPIRAKRSRELLRRAFALYRDAEKVVGELEPEVLNQFLPLHPGMHRAQGRMLALDAGLKHSSWCRKMLMEIYRLERSISSPIPLVAESPSESVGPTKAEPESEKPWLEIDPRDPQATQPWYIPARYFARQLVRQDSTLLQKKTTLANIVSKSLSGTGFKKRGGKQALQGATVLKALSNVILG